MLGRGKVWISLGWWLLDRDSIGERVGCGHIRNGRRGKARVFLNRKKYEAEIKIVSKDTKAKKFKVVRDPDVK